MQTRFYVDGHEGQITFMIDLYGAQPKVGDEVRMSSMPNPTDHYPIIIEEVCRDASGFITEVVAREKI